MSNGPREISSEDEEILKEATERFQRIQSDDKENRDSYRADTLFVYSPGNQWPEDVRQVRSGWREPCLEFNQLKQFVSQVVNDQLQNRPGIRYFPASGDASKEVAEILQGMARNIENESNAEAVYDNAFKSAVVGGRGAWRVCSEYSSADSFNQKIVIKPIDDMMNVYADLDYEQPDGSDRNFVFIACRYNREEFKRKWPNANPVNFDMLEACWSDSKDSIIVADYYRRVCKKRTLVMMTDGNTGFKDELPPADQWPEGVSIEREREVEDYKVEWFTINGYEVLERYEWPGQCIPVVIIAGDDMIINGKRCYQGLTRHARDAQAMLNYGMTQQAIHLSLTPRAPWVMAEGQNEGYEEMWRDANTRNFSALIYKPTSLDGVPLPPPQRTAPALPDAGYQAWTQMMIGMIKSTIGMYEQSLGQKGNEQSGKAIVARERQGDNATFNFVDNLAAGIAFTGRLLAEAFPVYYDTEQMVQVINPDDTRKMVMINQQLPNPDNPLQAIKANDITVGKYAVVSESGPSYATKRQESADNLLQLTKVVPQIGVAAPDILVRSLDLADADIIADRVKAMLPPQIQQADEARKDGKPAPDPKVMQQMQQQQQALEQAKDTMDQMAQKIKELESGVQEKIQTAQIDAQVKLQQSELDAQTAIQKANIDANAKLKVAHIDAETKLLIAQMSTPPELSATGNEVPAQEPQGTVQNDSNIM